MESYTVRRWDQGSWMEGGLKGGRGQTGERASLGDRRCEVMIDFRRKRTDGRESVTGR